ncbi:MAG: sugar phosphate isomerase/epimerase [Chloroflexi bacterium]|nr:sugar phosphate isomerase/epimerase [Chloroflexota bacterium]
MINVGDIGICLDAVNSPSRLHELERSLGDLVALGYRLVEIDPTPFALIVNGEIHRPQLDNFLAVIRNFDLRYSVHGLMRLNLAFDPRYVLCRRIMACQIEICRAMEAKTLVYHSGLQALDAVRHGVRPSLLTDAELAEGAQREVEAFRDLAHLAADAGVTIGMENGDPHLWEYTVITQHGGQHSHISKHHARLLVGPIVQQLEAIAMGNVGLTLDIGHLYIAAHELGFDYLEAVREASPWVKHLHVSDNFGRVDGGFDAEPDRWAFGEADIHMPPGWGSIPYVDVLNRLPEYTGDLILEIKPPFRDHLGPALGTMRSILDRLEAGCVSSSVLKGSSMLHSAPPRMPTDTD